MKASVICTGAFAALVLGSAVPATYAAQTTTVPPAPAQAQSNPAAESAYRAATALKDPAERLKALRQFKRRPVRPAYRTAVPSACAAHARVAT